MTGSHESRLEKLELQTEIDVSPPVYDWDSLEPGELEVIEHASEIDERAELEFINAGGVPPGISTRAYRIALLRTMSDDELAILEQAATILERIQA
jgi:hypothetical protein